MLPFWYHKSTKIQPKIDPKGPLKNDRILDRFFGHLGSILGAKLGPCWRPRRPKRRPRAPKSRPRRLPSRSQDGPMTAQEPLKRSRSIFGRFLVPRPMGYPPSQIRPKIDPPNPIFGMDFLGQASRKPLKIYQILSKALQSGDPATALAQEKLPKSNF